MQYHHMKRAVGLAMVTLALLVIVSLGLLIKEKRYFEPRIEYHFIVDNASELSIGTPLNYSGLAVGIVSDIALTDGGRARVSFLVDQTNQKWITQETILTVKRPLIGSAFIEISPVGSAAMMPQGSTINVKMSDDINDIIERLEPVVKKSLTVLENFETITSYLVKEDSELIGGLKNFNAITDKLAKSDSFLTSLTGDANATKSLIAAIHKLSEVLENVEKVSDDLAHMSGSLDTKIINPSSQTIKELGTIMKDIRNKLNLLHGLIKEIGDSKGEFRLIKKEIAVGIQKSNKIINKIDRTLGTTPKAQMELP